MEAERRSKAEAEKRMESGRKSKEEAEKPCDRQMIQSEREKDKDNEGRAEQSKVGKMGSEAEKKANLEGGKKVRS